MFPSLKIATLSAVLSAALVSGFAAQGARSTLIPSDTPKAFQDRVPQDATGGAPIVIAYASPTAEIVKGAASAAKADRLKAAPVSCADQAWPHLSRDCLTAAEGTPVRQVSRSVTLERRIDPNTSTLIKGAALTVAAR